MAAEQALLPGGRTSPAGRLASALGLVALAVAAQTLLAWLALAGLVTWVAMRGRLAWWPAIATAVLLVVLNSLKWPESDLAEYFVVLDDARRVPLVALLEDESALLSIRPTEPVFRAFMWLLARADPLPRVAFALVAGAAIYGTLMWLCGRVSRCGTDPDAAWRAACATAIALLVGVTFSLVGHLVRQYIAGGLFIVGVFGWAYTGRWRWWLWPVLACAIHNSALLLMLPLAVAVLLARRPRVFAATVLLVVAASLTGRIPLVGDLSEATSFLKEDGQIGLALPLLDSLLAAAAWLVWRRLPATERPASDTAARLLCFGIALGVLLFCIRDVPLLFFRSYFYLEFLRAPMLAFIVAAGLRRAGTTAWPAVAFALPLAALLCWLRARGADWDYGAANALWPEWLDVHSVVKRWQAIQHALL